jgi:hypothetical protein
MLIIPEILIETSYEKHRNNIDQDITDATNISIISQESVENLSENIEIKKDDEIINIEVIKQTFVNKVIQQNNIGRTNINTSNEIIPWAVRYPKRSKDIIINQKILKKTISIIQDEKSMKIVL